MPHQEHSFPTPPPLYTELGRRPGSQSPPLLPFWLRVGVLPCCCHTPTDALGGGVIIKIQMFVSHLSGS